jgi:hypothetical protein
MGFGRLHSSLNQAAQISWMLIARFFVLTTGWDYDHEGRKWNGKVAPFPPEQLLSPFALSLSKGDKNFFRICQHGARKYSLECYR